MASGRGPAPAPLQPVRPIPPLLQGRHPVLHVSPSVDSGRRPAAAVVGEAIPVVAACIREGHDALGAHVVLRRPDGTVAERLRASRDGDAFSATVRPDAMGAWSFDIETWGDPWSTWLHRAEAKVPVGVDVELELAEGAVLLDAAAKAAVSTDATVLAVAARTMRESALPASVRLAAATDPQVLAHLDANPLREHVTVSGPWPLQVQRRRALVGAWYELFPRSEGARLNPQRSGTFKTAAARLDAIAEMGFDIVYLPPIHPIGTTFRKGRNGSTTPGPDDVGSPWAIGSADGGHDAVHPDLGTIADFDAFVTRANALGMEVALDLALQASPDHPWVKQHPEWFTQRVDGTIAYAENPPKKYQDIYPLNFDNDPEGLYAEVERIVRHWMAHGVRVFRVDNPHTKPIWMWERLIASVNATDPDVIFLAEAFTRQTMMHALAKVGFQQSYTYFTWKNSAHELAEYASGLAGPDAAYMRPNFFTNTPDILNEYLQHGGPSAFAIRAVLASTLSPTYGIYSGFELYEHVAQRPGSEEYLDTEKFQLRPRDWDAARRQGRTLAPFVTTLNRLRREHPALQDLRSLHFHHSDNPQVMAFSKRDVDASGREDLVLVVCTVDPFREQAATIWWDMAALGMRDDEHFQARDLLTGATWRWSRGSFVRLSPMENVAHIIHVTKEQG